MIPFFTAGSRTYILSGLALALALLLQLDYTSVFELAPILKTAIIFLLTIITPLIPIYIRKAIADMQTGSNGAAQSGKSR